MYCVVLYNPSLVPVPLLDFISQLQDGRGLGMRLVCITHGTGIYALTTRITQVVKHYHQVCITITHTSKHWRF